MTEVERLKRAADALSSERIRLASVREHIEREETRGSNPDRLRALTDRQGWHERTVSIIESIFPELRGT